MLLMFMVFSRFSIDQWTEQWTLCSQTPQLA